MRVSVKTRARRIRYIQGLVILILLSRNEYIVHYKVCTPYR